jgi:hypothetical protein
VLGQRQDREQHDCTHGRVDLRFPGARVWDTPILSHEFGHHAIAHLRDRRPELPDHRPLREHVRDPLSKRLAGQGDPCALFAERHADELVADAVATACCGAAYAVATLCLRVPEEPEASAASSTHPAWRDRVAIMRATLNALSERTEHPRYSWQRGHVVDPLAAAVLGQPPEPSSACRDAADKTVTQILAHRSELIYQDCELAIDVRNCLDRGEGKPPGGATVTAVLDGAWQWRREHPSRAEDDTITRLITRYCRETVKGRDHGHG